MLVAEEDALEMLICCNKILHNVRAREYQVSPTLAWGGGDHLVVTPLGGQPVTLNAER